MSIKNRIGFLLILTMLGCQASRAAGSVGAIPVPLAVRSGTDLPSFPMQTETKSEENKPDIRYVIEKILIGKTEAEVKSLIGIPKQQQPNSWRINVQDTSIEINVIGDQWNYEATAGNYSASMDLCLFRGKVVAQKLQTRIRGNGRTDTLMRTTTDQRLINELLLDKTKTDKDLLMEEEEPWAPPKKDL